MRVFPASTKKDSIMTCLKVSEDNSDILLPDKSSGDQVLAKLLPGFQMDISKGIRWTWESNLFINELKCLKTVYLLIWLKFISRLIWLGQLKQYKTNTKQNRTKQNNTEQNNTKQNRTKQYKTIQNKTKHNKKVSLFKNTRLLRFLFNTRIYKNYFKIRMMKLQGKCLNAW